VFFEILSVVAFAFAVAGVFMLLARLLRIRYPRSAVPIVAAVAMVGFVVWARYTWAERTIAALPPDMVVVESYQYQGWLEPWTRLVPRVDRVLVLDRAATMRNPDHPEVALVTLRLIEEHQPVIETHQFVDCAKRRRAAMPGGEGDPVAAAEWIAGGEPARLFEAVCEAG